MCENCGTSSLLHVSALIVLYTVTSGARTYRGGRETVDGLDAHYLIKTERNGELKGEFAQK